MFTGPATGDTDGTLVTQGDLTYHQPAGIQSERFRAGRLRAPQRANSRSFWVWEPGGRQRRHGFCVGGPGFREHLECFHPCSAGREGVPGRTRRVDQRRGRQAGLQRASHGACALQHDLPDERGDRGAGRHDTTPFMLLCISRQMYIMLDRQKRCCRH